MAPDRRGSSRLVERTHGLGVRQPRASARKWKQLALLADAIVQTYQAEERYGRLYAAYAGAFLVGAMLWGWLIDARRPDPFDLLGAVVVLAGASIILWGREVFG